MRRFLPVALLVLTAAASAQPVQPGSRLDGIAAVVGEQVVLYSEVDALVQQTAQGREAPPDLWSRALDRLVGQRVIIDRARRDTTLNVTEDFVNQQVDAQVTALSRQLGGDAALETAYGRSIEEVRASLRQDVRDDLMLQQFQARRMRDVTITPGEVREWFDQIPSDQLPLVPELVRVAHIVQLPVADENARAERRAFADALRDSIVAEQATIEDLANRFSQDPGNSNRDGSKNGGLYTTLRLSDLETRFRAAAANAEIGAISPVFETPFGYHVMRVNERQGDQISFNHVLITVETGESEGEAAKERLTVLRDSVLAGAPFEAIARRNSEDPFSAPRGGFVADPQTRQRDLQINGLGPLWQATLDTLEVGEISMPGEVQLLDGTQAYHIVLLQKRAPEHTLSIADDYSLLSQYALQDKQGRILEEWLADLRRMVYVEIRADEYQPAGES
ncbi:MAG: peptidylprolyl isomerase [Bacteroidota bacterium]